MGQPVAPQTGFAVTRRRSDNTEPQLHMIIKLVYQVWPTQQ